MASILEQGKRGKWLPRITDGGTVEGDRFVKLASGEHDGVYTLQVWTGQGNDRREYEVQLTEDEMLGATGTWLSKLASKRVREKKFAKRS